MFNIYKLFQPQEFLPDIEPLLNKKKNRNNRNKDDKIPQTQSAKMPHKSCCAMRGAQFEKPFRMYRKNRPPGGLE